MVIAPTRRSTVASRTLAEQLRPLVAVHRSIQERGYLRVDVEHARTRIQSGRTGFDAPALFEHLPDLGDAFASAAAAMELAGLASAAHVAALRWSELAPNTLLFRWAAGEAPGGDPVVRLSRRVAGVVGNAILSAIARDVMAGVPRFAWKRPRCPCCGSAPDLAFVTEVRRHLVCSRCDATWLTDDRGCLGCGADVPPALVRIPSPYLGYELAVCNACGRYLKERRGGLTHEAIVERMLTAGLDDAAQVRGLRT